jgi:uncharacterized protein
LQLAFAKCSNKTALPPNPENFTYVKAGAALGQRLKFDSHVARFLLTQVSGIDALRRARFTCHTWIADPTNEVNVMASEKQSGSNADKSKQQGGSGNFADDPQRASEAGKKGGQHSQGGSSGQSNQSGSGRSQHGSTQDGDTGDSDDKGRGSHKNAR